MYLKNVYWWHQDVLPNNFIEDLFKIAKTKKFDVAVISQVLENNNDKKLVKEMKKDVRNANAIFLSDNWIYATTNPIVHAANQKAGWNFQWDWNEPAQLGKYGKGQFYNWHMDSVNEPYNIHPGHPENGKIRKLSTIIALNDSSEYEGGEVVFDARDSVKGSRIIHCKELQKKGTVVTFPSFVWHRVQPVTKGIRYSLVIWHLGNPFI